MGYPSAGQDRPAVTPDSFDVSWDTPGPGSAQSMPIGNGDIGLNVWTAANGDLVFYISKTDAWGGETDPAMDPWMKQGGVLMKLGAVRLSLHPAPLLPDSHSRVDAAFRQVLRLRDGEVLVREGEGAGAVLLRVWVDANNPVIRVEAKSGHPLSLTVDLDDWRIGRGDSILPAEPNRITWYHRNAATADPNLADPHLADLTFGAMITGKGLTRSAATTLRSVRPVTTQLISIYPLTAATPTAGQWLHQLDGEATRIGSLDLEQTRKAHRQWWDKFWHRSWVFVQGDSMATEVTRGYVLQRFVTACAGRGAYPIKFNGSIFTVDNPVWKTGRDAAVTPMNADFRAWGGQYWFQNTRPMYWPRLMAGDFDMMLPLFRMYAAILPANTAQVKNYYGHAGAYFAETAPYWGGLLYMGPEVEALYTHHYFTPILELSMMMLDYLDYTGDTAFARKTLLPVARAGLEFFDRHFGRDAQGQLLLDPDNSIEMFWKVHDPAPDIAALRAVLPRMIALPDALVDAPTRAAWTKMLSEVPELPTGLQEGKTVLLPYTGEQKEKPHNTENPELYAVYPFRLYGLNKPGLSLAQNTFLLRKQRAKGCWVQDPIEAAMLGFAATAKEYVSYNLTRKEPRLKFPAFWASGNDYTPDEDNGGNGENGLQQMLLQADGKKILLLPAWPEEWNADFKLHAPYRTTVEGRVEHGKLTRLVVTPASREKDVIILPENHGHE
jgi:alpha-L-fucosidase 2